MALAVIAIEQLDKLLSDSRCPDRPEVRAKSSIELVALVAQQSQTIDEDIVGLDQELWSKAWSSILYGLADQWPLVREAFEEQLIKMLQHSGSLLQKLQQPTFMERIISMAHTMRILGKDKIDFASGILSLGNLSFTSENGPMIEVSASYAWSIDRVKSLSELVMDGWIGSRSLDQKMRACQLLTKSFTRPQLIQVLGMLVTSPPVQQRQTKMLVEFCEAVLLQLPLQPDDQGPQSSHALAAPIVKDWALVLWLCDRLWIPSLFATPESIQGSAETLATAKSFAEGAITLLKCIGHVDNTFTLHRLIIACASFTNSTDLWHKLDQSVSKQMILNALQNLDTLRETTPWTISADGPIASSSTLPQRHPIMIPGSFSDYVIQVIEKELRPSFTHVKAQKVMERGQTTIASYQENIKQDSLKMMEDVKEPDSEVVGGLLVSESKILAKRQKPSSVNQYNRILIASVIDAPNDEEEAWMTHDDEAAGGTDPSQPKRWDRTFLGSVSAVEWCAQQRIQDTGRVHEVFMLLVGPILAMIDSPQHRYQLRGLDLLTRFLIQHHHQEPFTQVANARTSTSASRRRPGDSRIWIKIFERTGLDQVLERSLKPLLAPIEVYLTITQPLENSLDIYGSNYQLEVISAAFRAYLTLILVNTVDEDEPSSATDQSHVGLDKKIGGRNADGLTVENLFMHAVLGSFQRAKPSKEYKVLILGWATLLIGHVISVDCIREQLRRRQQQPDLGLDQSNPDTSLEVAVVEEDRRFQGIYGLGSLTTKYLPTLIPYLCDILDYQFLSSSVDERMKNLNLAWKATDALCATMNVSRARIPRYRGKILTSIASCWANSRVFPTAPSSKQLSRRQSSLDNSLVRAIQLITEICQPIVAANNNQNGLEMDLKILTNLDPSVFDPLFAFQQ
ncbi:hypothetical protein EDD11_002583 [Mortierella claussenii]|nr:hypothetical protein EDD11_002583 [Mortierella claussenii]